MMHICYTELIKAAPRACLATSLRCSLRQNSGAGCVGPTSPSRFHTLYLLQTGGLYAQ